jgi:hypothetical protein
VCGGEDAGNGKRIQWKRGVHVSCFSIFVSASDIPVDGVFQSGVALRLPPQSKFVTAMPCLLEILLGDFNTHSTDKFLKEPKPGSENSFLFPLSSG